MFIVINNLFMIIQSYIQFSKLKYKKTEYIKKYLFCESWK